MTDPEMVAVQPFTDAHEGITTFHDEKVQEMDARLADICECHPTFKHRWADIHLSLGVCPAAAGDHVVQCQDAMTHMLEDLHDNLWYEHKCYDRVDN